MKELYSMKEAAEVLGTTVNKVNELRRAGLIRCMKLGSFKVRGAELDRFLQFAEGKDISDPFDVRSLES